MRLMELELYAVTKWGALDGAMKTAIRLERLSAT